MENPYKSFIQKLEFFWGNNFIPQDEQCSQFESFKKNHRKQLFKSNKTYAALTEVMLLRMAERQIEAEKLTDNFRKAFNRMANPLFAHRWRRMQIIESFRLGTNTHSINHVISLIDDADKNQWPEEQLKALFLQHLFEKKGGYFNKALKTAQQLKLLANQLQNQYYILQAAWAVAHIYFYFDQMDAALNECLRVRHLFGNDYSQPQHVAFYLLLADCMVGCKRLDEAAEIFNSLEDFLNKPGAPMPVTYLHVISNIASISAKRSEYGKAIEAFNKALLLSRQLKQPEAEVNIHINLAGNYLKQNEYALMDSAIKNGMLLAKRLNHLQYDIKLLQLKAKHAEAIGDNKLALKIQQQYHERYESWQHLENHEKLRALETRHELELQKMKETHMKKELAYLEQEMQQLNAHLEQKNKLINQFSGYFNELEQTNIRRKEIFTKLREMVNTVKLSQNNERAQYSSRFNEAHQQAIYTLCKAYPEITNAEAGTAIMLSSGLSNKDIASLTLTTVRNIEKHRFNLRRKLKLKRDNDLVKSIRHIISEQDK